MVLLRDVVPSNHAVDRCSGITFLGLTDGDSWLNDGHWGAMRGPGPHYPLPFNNDMKHKPMVAGILEGLANAPPLPR